MLDAKNLCEVQDVGDGKVRYAIKPADKYPATVARVKELLSGDELPTEAVMSHVRADNRLNVMQIILKALVEVPEEGWDYLLTPTGEFSDGIFDDSGDAVVMKSDIRRLAMQNADKYFQRVLRAQIGGGAHGGTQLIRIHTLSDEDYNL